MLIKEPKKVAELLATFLEWKAAQGLEINSVYFAAPPTEMKFILDVRTVRSPVRPRISSYIFVRLRTILRKYLKKKDIHVLTAIEMIEYIEDKYSSCEEVTNNKYDLLRKAFIKLHAFQQRMQDNDIERYESR